MESSNPDKNLSEKSIMIGKRSAHSELPEISSIINEKDDDLIIQTQKPQQEESKMTSLYIFKNGLRLVKPYTHEFVTFTKKRWLKDTLLDVYSREFLSHPKQYYEQAIIDGRISINKQKVSPSYLLRDNDRIVHSVHRHETPVYHTPIDILYEDENILVVDKPPSLPVHEGGNFKHNTLIGILENEMKYKGLKCMHRLDKQTSGVIFIAKNYNTTNQFREALESDEINKMYYARVKGDFREIKETVVKKWVFMKEYKNLEHDCEDFEKLTDEQKKTAKESETKFEFERYHEKTNTSIVKCFPRTGRTHQIRVHLKSLGMPIANDQVYGGEILNDGKGKEVEWQEEFDLASTNKEGPGAENRNFLMLWLHSFQYKFNGIEVQTKIPSWVTTE